MPSSISWYSAVKGREKLRFVSYAQEESRSASENQKWRIKKCFEAGIPYDPTLLGYRIRDGKYVIELEEAKTVRRIYEEYLSGKGIQTIANELNRDGIVTRFGMEWHTSGVQRILRNITYTGNLLLQKTFSENHITKRKMASLSLIARLTYEIGFSPFRCL